MNDHKGGATAAWDEVARGQARGKAADLLKSKGWEPGDNFSITAMLGLMVEFAEQAHTVTDRCGYPECGCDFDATCAGAIPPSDYISALESEVEMLSSVLAKTTEALDEVGGFRAMVEENRKILGNPYD